MNTNNKPLETELVNSSFNNAYKDVMALGTAVESRQAGIESSIATLASDVGDITNLTTTDKTDLVAAINEVDSDIASEASARAAADTQLANTKQNNLTSAQLTAVNSGVSAVTVAQVATNKGNIGELSNLTTSAKGDLVHAINEVDSHADTNASNISSLQSGKQDKLSSTQMDAVNSGITSTDTAQITTNKNAISSLQSSKQDALSSAQLAAANSGIDSTKVAQIATNTSNISSLSSGKQDKELATPITIEEVEYDTVETAIGAINDEVATLNSQNVKTTGDQTIEGVKTFADAPNLPTLLTTTPVQSSAGVGYDAEGNLVPIETLANVQLPEQCDYIATDVNGNAIGETADTTPTLNSSKLVTSGGVASALAGKQDSLDSGQLAAVNSGVTSGVVEQVSTNAGNISSLQSDVAGKQDSLDSGQLAAVNSGIDSTKVAQIATNASAISSLNTTVASKQSTITGAATTITSSNLTVNRALISTSTGKVAVSDVTSTELGYLDGVTSNVQTQLDGKVPTTRTVNGKALSANITLAASDVGAVPTTRKVAGHALSADVTVSKSDVGLGNVVNTGDSATPTSGGTTKFTTGGAYTLDQKFGGFKITTESVMVSVSVPANAWTTILTGQTSHKKGALLAAYRAAGLGVCASYPCVKKESTTNYSVAIYSQLANAANLTYTLVWLDPE